VLVAETPRFSVELGLPKYDVAGSLAFHFAPAMASGSGAAVMERFPGGHHVPPPPPGSGAPAELAGAYVVDRPWGRWWFRLAMEPGVHGSPGV
jgi:hypothetical protein